ncbi:hypothetical protein ACL02U_27455 [Streptomyces sp. MS06]|uniref:hypothetical protein n=1 Tax=Streptomyces sp. MS06 TaxID=3385974 RepID=UPI00399F3A2D
MLDDLLVVGFDLCAERDVRIGERPAGESTSGPPTSPAGSSSSGRARIPAPRGDCFLEKLNRCRLVSAPAMGWKVTVESVDKPVCRLRVNITMFIVSARWITEGVLYGVTASSAVGAAV